MTREAEARGLSPERYLEEMLTAYAAELRTETPAEAVAQIRELRKGQSLGGLSIKDLVNEGRKY